MKQQVLEFESHLAAATSKQQITESTSLLISQLTRMEPTYVNCHMTDSYQCRMQLTVLTSYVTACCVVSVDIKKKTFNK